MATVVVLGALDTKGEEVRFLTSQIEKRGHKTLVVDVGVLGKPAFAPFVTRDEVATAADASLAPLIAEADRGRAVTTMSRGATVVVQRMLARGQLDAIIAMGGGAGTSIGTAAMRTRTCTRRRSRPGRSAGKFGSAGCGHRIPAPANDRVPRRMSNG